MRAFRALTCLCLLSLTAACARTPVPVTTTVYRNVYIPDSLLAGCPGAEWAGGTYRNVGELAAKRKTALQDCDDKFTEARRYQDEIRTKEDRKVP